MSDKLEDNHCFPVFYCGGDQSCVYRTDKTNGGCKYNNMGKCGSAVAQVNWLVVTNKKRENE